MSWFPEPHARIFCAAVNYRDHRAEMGRGEEGPHPMLFLRTPRSLAPAGAPLLRPAQSERFDWEGELAAIIGTAGRNVPRERALDLVGAWAPFMDGSVRDWQRHTAQFTPGKNFDASGSIGDAPVSAAEWGDYRGRKLETRVNGEVVQSTDTSLMIHDVETLIEYITVFTELLPGDIIATGTCGGVGDKLSPPRYLKPGDVVEVAVTGLPTLSNPVAQA
jgi:2-keto-4-pentenoate hydratase/2-oxohepta-3-ene-1,7-dioic acid hydratase in catechol pathway